MIPVLTSKFRVPSMNHLVLFGLLALCALVDWPRQLSMSGTTLLGMATLGSCGIIWALFLLQPVISNHLLKAILFLIFFNMYCIATMLWAHTGIDGVQMVTVGMSFLGLIIVTARETSANPETGQTLHRVLLIVSTISIGLYGLVILTEAKLGDGVDGSYITNRGFALYALPVVAVALAQWRALHNTKIVKLFALGWALVVTVTIALSMSRTALVCALLLFPLAIFLRLNKKSMVVSVMSLVVGGGLLGIAIMSYQPLYNRFFGDDASMKVAGVAINASGRTKIWDVVLRSVQGDWLFGKGVATSQVLVRQVFNGFVGQPHNDYIRYYYDTGAFGLTLWLCFAFAFMTRTVKSLRRSIREETPDYPLHLAAFLAFVGVSGSMLTDNSVCYSFVMMPLAIVMGCSLGASRSALRPVLEVAGEDYFPPIAQLLPRDIRILTKRPLRAEPTPIETVTGSVNRVPKVSVVMAVYNTESFLQEAVDSVLAQTFKDFEFVIINDGSTDHSLAMLQRYTDPRIRIIDQENHGLIDSLNKGIELSRGQYIARMDADDRCEPDRLDLQVRSLDRNSDIALIGGAISTMDELGNQLAPRVEFPVTHEQIWANIGRKPWVFCHPAVMFRRDAAIDVGMYRTGFAHAEDAEFFARMMSKYQAANLPDVVLNYRLRRSAISFTKAGHGRVNAELVATIIDRWEPGQPFAPNQDERLAADLAIAMCGGQDNPVEIEAAYHLRLGRELLRGRQWKRAFNHYFTAAKSDPWGRMAYIGIVCALIHYGGAPLHPEEKIIRPQRIPNAGHKPRMNAF